MRVVALDHYGANKDQMALLVKKWVGSGKGYPMYTKENNCLMKLTNSTSGYPASVAAKKNKVEKIQHGYPGFSESDLKRLFGFR